MKNARWMFPLMITALGTSCSSASPSTSPETEFARLTQTTLEEHHWIPSVLASVQWGEHQWSGASGVLDRQSKIPLPPHATFRIASVTKTFTAASIFRLAELGKLRLSDPLSQHLTEPYVAVLREKGYAAEKITLGQVLTHTSGLPDYAETEAYITAVMAQPRKRWTRMEQVKFAVDHFSKVGNPGETYAYSDTGYIMLGEILEQQTGLSLGAAFKNLLGLPELGLTSTWQEGVEPIPENTGPFAHPYFGDLDAAQLDPSNDLWGGGGLVSTTRDLVVFFRALFQDKVLSHASMKQMMQIPDGNPYAHGLYPQKLGRLNCWGHTGFWGAAVYHCPEKDITVAVSINAFPATLLAQLGQYSPKVLARQLVEVLEPR